MSIAPTNATHSAQTKWKDPCPFPHDTTGAIARERLQDLHASNFSLGWGNEDIELKNGGPKQYYISGPGGLASERSPKKKGPKAGHFGSQFKLRDDWDFDHPVKHEPHPLTKKQFFSSELAEIFGASEIIQTQVQPKKPNPDGIFKSTLGCFAAIEQVANLIDALRKKLAEKGVR